MELQKLINEIYEELENPSINRQRSRHLNSYLEELLNYQKNHPEELNVPTSLELYCDSNPDASECKIYDD
jgi:hypothetical protein